MADDTRGVAPAYRGPKNFFFSLRNNLTTCSFQSQQNIKVMPEPVTLTTGAIVAGSALLGTGANAYVTGRMNKRSMKFAREMYERQKADNLAFWRMQNQYNSPQAQMQRFQEAGLNPHLIYGRGDSGQAGLMTAPHPGKPQFDVPDFSGIGNAGVGLAGIYDLEMKAAQADNLRTQNTVLIQEALLKAAQTLNIGAQTERSEFDLEFEKELRDVSAEARREALRQLKTNIQLSENKDAREALANSMSLKEAAERMLNMKVQRSKTAVDTQKSRADIVRTHTEIERLRENMNLLRQQGQLNEFEISLRKLGLSYSDPLYQRLAARFLDAAQKLDKPSFQKSVKEFLKSLF